MNLFKQTVCYIGLPLGIIVGIALKLMGFEEGEGFEGLATWLGLCYYCGIVTLVVVPAFCLWWFT